MQRAEQVTTQRIEIQQKLYQEYAYAAEAYVKKPTISNWEKKEKAFENYNALIRFKKQPAEAL